LLLLRAALKLSARPSDLLTLETARLRSALRPSMTALLACAAAALAACEHGIDLQGKVSLPSDVQQMFSSQHPGELVVKAQIPGQPDITAPGVILCEPIGGDRVVDVKVTKLGCASEDTALVSAWIVPRAATEVSCGAAPPPSSTSELSQSNAIASARAVVSVSVATMSPTSCRDGSISFALTLAPR
jgi:hypothetical protein